MKIEYKGPFIRITIAANEVSDNFTNIQLADGYTYERIFIQYMSNAEFASFIIVTRGDDLTFPVVNSKSPSILPLHIIDTSKEVNIGLTIEKFGQIPDPHYFDTAFEPILVTGDDGNEYNVIPSTQFK